MSPVLTDNETALLRWAFAKNPRFSDWLADDPKVPIYTWISYSDVLIDVDKLPIQGIQEKLKEVGDPEKLLSTLSELRAANELAKRDFEVELLLDNDRRFPKSSPDLLVSRGESKMWVEVTRKYRDDSDFVLYQKLSPLLEERDFTLSVFYSERLSELAVTSGDREVKKNMFNDFVEKLEQRLNSLDRAELPCEFVLDDATIFVELADPGWGRLSFGATSLTESLTPFPRACFKT